MGSPGAERAEQLFVSIADRSFLASGETTVGVGVKERHAREFLSAMVTGSHQPVGKNGAAGMPRIPCELPRPVFQADHLRRSWDFRTKRPRSTGQSATEESGTLLRFFSY